ncbi:ERVV2 protein, partial [Notiomystis cincta]|nr:ERVV2 protein [Notiomystis cincta]
TAFHFFVRWFIPWLGVSNIQKALVYVSAVMESISNSTTDAIQALQAEISEIDRIATQNKIAFETQDSFNTNILTSQGGACAVVNASCCVFSDQSGRVSTDLQ